MKIIHQIYSNVNCTGGLDMYPDKNNGSIEVYAACDNKYLGKEVIRIEGDLIHVFKALHAMLAMVEACAKGRVETGELNPNWKDAVLTKNDDK